MALAEKQVASTFEVTVHHKVGWDDAWNLKYRIEPYEVADADHDAQMYHRYIIAGLALNGEDLAGIDVSVNPIDFSVADV